MSVFGGIPAGDSTQHGKGLASELGPHHDSSSSLTKTIESENEKPTDIDEEIRGMVRQLTRHSTRFSSTQTKNPFFEEDKETTWHPDSPFFKSKDWIRALITAQSQHPDRFIQRSAGVAFKNLHVHGFGSPTDYQKDVFNAILSIGGLFRSLAGTGQQRVQILNGFHGLARSGEMLLVLGRPGR